MEINVQISKHELWTEEVKVYDLTTHEECEVIIESVEEWNDGWDCYGHVEVPDGHDVLVETRETQSAQRWVETIFVEYIPAKGERIEWYEFDNRFDYDAD